MIIKSKFLFLASLLLFIFIFMGASSAANHTVSPGAYSIQNAVNTAASGDTLNLNAGTYNEHDIIIDKDLTIIGPEIFGANEPVVVINGQGQGRVFNIVSGVTVNLQNLKIEQGSITGNGGGGIYNSGTVNINKCTITQNTADYGGGIYNNPGYATVTDSNINNNTATVHEGGGGIYNYQGTLKIIRTAINSNSDAYISIKNNGGTVIIDGSAQNPGWNFDIVDAPGDVGRNTSIAVDRNNNPHIFYYDRSVKTWKYAHKENGFWYAETIDSTGPNEYYRTESSLAVDGDGNPHVLYNAPEGLKYAYKTNGIWNYELVDNRPPSYSTIALDSQGNPHIAYGIMLYNDEHGYYYAWGLYYRFRSDWGWSSALELDNSSSGYFPSIAIDKEDNAHIAYLNGRKVIYLSQGMGSGFYREEAYSAGGIITPSDVSLSLALDTQGNPHISFKDIKTDGAYFLYIYKDDTWHSQELQVPTAPRYNESSGMNNSIVTDSRGNSHITYYFFDGASGEFGETSLRYLTQNSNGEWNNPLIVDTYPTLMSSIGPYNGYVGKYCSIAIDSNDNPCISYYDQINGNLVYAYYQQTQAPTVTASPRGSHYNSVQTVTLTTVDPDSAATTFYTLDGSDPQISWTRILYTSPIQIDASTVLLFCAVDPDGNWSDVYSQHYIIDTIAPIVTANPLASTYNSAQTVTLTTVDNNSATTYYTTDGSDPTINGQSYNNPIQINTTTILKYAAVDPAGNWSPIYIQTYVIDTSAPIVTANPLASTFNGVQMVTLTTVDDSTATTYYSTDGSDPTINGQTYVSPIQISVSTVLRYVAVDVVGNWSQVYSQNYVMDNIVPTASATPIGGNFNTIKIVNLNMSESGTIYYTTDGSKPTTNSSIYSNPINLASTTTLKFLAVDLAGNQSSVYTETYNIDTTAPTASATPVGSSYNTSKTVNLNISEAGTIYYTLNGATPTKNSAKYKVPILISSTKTLKFLAVDLAGNQSPIYTHKYTIDKTAPKVSTSNPTNGKTGVKRNQTITVTFNENIKTGSNYSKITLKSSTGKTVTITKSISGKVLTIKHSTLMAANTKYILTLYSGCIRDLAGNPLAAKTINFTTGST